MNKPARHLHRGLNATICGLDASYLLMTYDRGDATCSDCRTTVQEADAAAASDRRDAEDAASRQAAAAAQEHERHEEMQRRHQERTARLIIERDTADAERSVDGGA